MECRFSGILKMGGEMLWKSAIWQVMATAVSILVLCPLLATAQDSTGDSIAIARAVGDGVYTLEQAIRGDSLAQTHCGSCHSKDEWRTQAFLDGWTGLPVNIFFVDVSTTMPPPPAGNLTPEQYVDIIAYILQVNGAPPGESELPSDRAGLATILMSQSLPD
jgi:hypothetical protein